MFIIFLFLSFLGLPNNNLLCRSTINAPTNISSVHNICGKLVSCGNEHSLILSNNNEVYGILKEIILK